MESKTKVSTQARIDVTNAEVAAVTLKISEPLENTKYRLSVTEILGDRRNAILTLTGCRWQMQRISEAITEGLYNESYLEQNGSWTQLHNELQEARNKMQALTLKIQLLHAFVHKERPGVRPEILVADYEQLIDELADMIRTKIMGAEPSEAASK